MATPISEECYSDEEDDFVTSNSYEDGEDLDDYNHGGGEEGDMSGWQLAARGIKLALNNRIEDAQNLLRVDSSDHLPGNGHMSGAETFGDVLD